MEVPALSVIIPTCGRPHYLPRAIDSALQSAGGCAIEIIVVPNGPDESWKQLASLYVENTNVKWSPINTSHANAARNHGLALARGRYVRFLDDDDLLYESASRIQCDLLEKTGADICSGMVDLITDEGLKFSRRVLPETDDFIEAMLAPERITLPTSHVYRRESLGLQKWGENDPIAQDILWMYQLCASREWGWIALQEPVGAWRHHHGPRTSRSIGKRRRGFIQAESLFETAKTLSAEERLTAARSKAASRALWRLICGHFFFDPKQWGPVLKKTQDLFPESRPDFSLYKLWPKIPITPKLVLTASIPVQKIKYQIKKIRVHLGMASPEITI